MNRELKNWRTTALGFAAGAFYYIQTCGCTIPTTWAELKVFAGALLIAAIGFVAKDARTGSAPGDPGNMSAPQQGGSAMKTLIGLFVAMAAAVTFMAPAAQAGLLSDSNYQLSTSEPYWEKPVFYAGIALNQGNIEERGAGGYAVFGPLAVLTSTSIDANGVAHANRVMSLTFSLGVVGTSDPSPGGSTYGGSLGFGPCWMNDLLCTHGGIKVASDTGKRSTQLMAMMKVIQF